MTCQRSTLVGCLRKKDHLCPLWIGHNAGMAVAGDVSSAGEARNAIVSAISSGLPRRRIGIARRAALTIVDIAMCSD